MGAHLIWVGCDVLELAERFGTPLYVMDEEALRCRCRRLQRAATARSARVCYGGKAFLPLAMAQLVHQEGLGLDVVSPGELYLARQAGFPMDKVMVHGNAKTLELLTMALDWGVGHLVVDSEDELKLLAGLASEGGKRQRILIRVSPGIEAQTHRFIQTAQKDCKFGIPLDHLDRAVAWAMEAPSLELTGLHVHIGSQIRETSGHLRAVETMAHILAGLKERLGFQASELDLGGGFGIPNLPGDEAVRAEDFIEAMMDRLESCCCQLGLAMPLVFFEPGRWVVGEAGITLYRVQSIKEIPGVRIYAAVDGGMTDNPRPMLYQADYSAALASDLDRPGRQRYAVAGPCCETGDVMAYDLELPPLKSGDLLAVFQTGAYNFSMFNGYNCTRRPGVVFAREGQAREVVQRQTFQDLLRGHVGLED